MDNFPPSYRADISPSAIRDHESQSHERESELAPTPIAINAEALTNLVNGQLDFNALKDLDIEISFPTQPELIGHIEVIGKSKQAPQKKTWEQLHALVFDVANASLRITDRSAVENRLGVRKERLRGEIKEAWVLNDPKGRRFETVSKWKYWATTTQVEIRVRKGQTQFPGYKRWFH
ncbi:hypothetical protein BHYA_0022g00580 [Botrytis hyacinthi]|uniref:Uncharacterized protein n=1 Tax=Botrytis hyacinthi TaxID=278943 RepID=A0A4Z1GWZ9_9HELO|nr:hypothetical protein BHYA_0022g00580 [Botrytis hyacinthi]